MITTGLKIQMAKNFIMAIVLIGNAPIVTGYLVLHDFDAGRHANLFNER
jgi:hypothetical protein